MSINHSALSTGLLPHVRILLRMSLHSTCTRSALNVSPFNVYAFCSECISVHTCTRSAPNVSPFTRVRVLLRMSLHSTCTRSAPNVCPFSMYAFCFDRCPADEESLHYVKVVWKVTPGNIPRLCQLFLVPCVSNQECLKPSPCDLRNHLF